jgi:hypothetical protein
VLSLQRATSLSHAADWAQGDGDADSPFRSRLGLASALPLAGVAGAELAGLSADFDATVDGDEAALDVEHSKASIRCVAGAGAA